MSSLVKKRRLPDWVAYNPQTQLEQHSMNLEEGTQQRQTESSIKQVKDVCEKINGHNSTDVLRNADIISTQEPQKASETSKELLKQRQTESSQHRHNENTTHSKSENVSKVAHRSPTGAQPEKESKYLREPPKQRQTQSSQKHDKDADENKNYCKNTDVLIAANRTSTQSQSKKDSTSEKELSQHLQSERSQKHIKGDSESKKASVVSKVANRGTTSDVKDFAKLLEGVIFTISGLVNPERSELRKMALDMGAQYRPSWTDDSTLLVCAFLNSPTFKQVQAAGGTIVNKEWIVKCYRQRELVAIEKYLMQVGNPWRTGNHVDDSANLLENDFPVQESSSHEKYDSSVEHQKPTLWSHTMDPQKNVASPADVEQWVLDDLAATLTWLERQSEKPEKSELEAVAGQGLLVCLEDGVRSLQEDKGLSLVMDNWAFIPRAVKELATYEQNGQCGKDEVINEGKRLKVIYELMLKKLGIIANVPGDNGSLSPKIGNDRGREALSPQPGMGEESFVDDDATEIMSDVDSRDPADFDSDDTQELDEEEIASCQNMILQTFTLH